MIPFLKYEQFFVYTNSKKIGKNKKEVGGSLVNTVIGSIPNFRHFRTILEEIFPNTVKKAKGNFITSTGAGVLAIPYSAK